MTHDEAPPPQSPKRILVERGLRPRKRFGQNFLVDPRFAQAVAGALPPQAFVVEIGAGTGSLTVALAESARHVTALEIDRDLVQLLRERFAKQPNVSIHETDALQYDFRTALAEEAAPRAVCGNLPYYITTPLIERVLEAADSWEAAVLMVQREYAKRLVAAPGSADYGSLTVFVAYFCQAEKLCDIGPAGFYPAPEVSSSVVRLTPKRDRALPAADEARLLRLIRAAFAQRRKTLSNCIVAAAPASDRAVVNGAIRSAGLDPGVRGERLSLSDFTRLAAALSAADVDI